MSEILEITKEKANAYIERAYCTDCKGVELERSNMVLTTYPLQYTYQCPKCGKSYTSFERYPKVIYEKIYEKTAND